MLKIFNMTKIDQAAYQKALLGTEKVVFILPSIHPPGLILPLF